MRATKAAIDSPVPVRMADLEKAILVPRAEWELWLETWDWTYHQLGRGEFPKPFKSLDRFQWACFCADRVLWVKSFLREPEDPDHKDPYNLFDYQEESLLFPGNTIHKTAAEVGKTREIVAIGLYFALTTPNGSGLIGAPLQSHLEEIIEAMDEQTLYNPEIGKARSHRRHRDGWKKHPHHAFYFTNDFKIDFKPSGDKGVAYRGVHARTFAIKDEGVKDKNPSQWSEFWRAVKPGCVSKIYSVPDGDRSCDFYKLGERAFRPLEKPADIKIILRKYLYARFRERVLHPKKLISIPSPEDFYGPLQKTDDDKEAPVEIESMKGIRNMAAARFMLYHWLKPLMPHPFWSQERKEFFREQYNGEDSPLYKHNVLGIDGDPESSVFPWDQLKYCIKDIPEYRCLKIMVDSSNNEVIVRGYKTELVPGDSGPVAREVSIMDTVFGKHGFFDAERGESEFRRLIKSFFVSVPGLKRGGADFGYSGDPTEIIIKNIIGTRKRVVARLQLKHVLYDQQCQALDALDDIYGPGITWGTDYGNAGSAVAHDLQGLPQYSQKNYDDRLRGFQFESTTDNIDETGEAIIDAKDGKPVKITLKELATDHMVKAVQTQTVEYPPDPDFQHFYTNHTVSYASKHRVYKKIDDHLIDADRAETLAAALGVQAEEYFASGSNIR